MRLTKFYYQICSAMISSNSSQSHMQRNKNAEERIVYKLSKTAVMKFRPERALEDSSSSGFISRIKSLSKIFSRQDRGTSDSLRKSNDLQSVKSGVSGQGLKFLFRLDNESFLIGTAKQLDAISLAVVEDYIQSEQLWSIRPKSAILNLLVDDRRKTIVAVLAGELNIYSYEGRRSKAAPKLEKMLKVVGEVKMMQIAKDSLLVVFFEDSVHSYYLDGPNSRQNSRKQYRTAPQKKLALFQLAPCAENVINVFFECPAANQKFFQLWSMPIQIMPNKLQIGEVTKIYEVQHKHRSNLRIESIARDSYFMNLGQEILMFRKGYCVDKVKINQRVEGTVLKYFGERRQLVHVSPLQIDFYNVTIDLVTNPPKLAIKSFDSITQIEHPKFLFLDAIKFQDHKLAFFYQLPSPNVSGEVKYSFALTQKWRFQQKIDSILPKISDYNGKYEGAQFGRLLQEIEVSCDAVGKMGMSRKQAYLRIWRQSKKEQVEQFKLLLDTLDYATVRQQILLKLRKKAMLFNEVHKVQSGCLGMIGQNVFSAKGFSMDQLKNYLISHFLIRKLELFKEIRLFEKKAGKVKLTESEINDRAKSEKLYINIQEYTNTVKMDLKAYLLQMIYNLVRGKDLSTEIRILVHKFRFAFLYIYQALLKEIIFTAKQNLLMLLQTLPELLPYQHPQVQDPYENSLRQGLWAPVTEEEWEGALLLETVTTIYNKELVTELRNSLWAKRYWLTNHDMIFMNRLALSAEWQRTRGEHLFYSLIEHIFQNYTNQGKIEELVHYIEETYVKFPPHLFNNVFLYRELYLYFNNLNVMQEPFQSFLRKVDEEIFKKIFDHQKFKKGSLLRQVKPIYERLKQSDKFNVGLLKYFSSPLSEVSDIKYLLNRINNQKKEFHDEHMEMYEVLVKGMQIKLKLGSDKDIPIPEVLIYIENIPLAENNPVTEELKILKKINEVGEKFQRMKLNMSVFQMIRNRDSVFISTVAFEIDNSGLRSCSNAEEILEKSRQILKELSDLRSKIYGPFQDNVLLFIFLVKLVQTKQLIPFVPQIIQQNKGECRFDGKDIENVVFYCYRQQMMTEPVYSKSQEYLLALIPLLPQDNPLRIFISCEIQLALIFSHGGRDIKYPICGDGGLITKHELQGLFDGLPKEPLLTIDVAKVFELSSSLQRIAGGSMISLRQLHQFHFCALLKKGALHRAIECIDSMITLDPGNIGNILFPIMIFKHIACQFIQENKALMMGLLASLFRKPHQLLRIFQQLMGKSFSNQDQKQFLSQISSQSLLPAEQRIKMDNILFHDDFLQYLKARPQFAEKVCELFQMQLSHLSHSNQDFAKSVDVTIYHLLLMQEPILLVRYVQLNRYSLNLKEVRSFFSHICKYDAFDTIKVIEFAKRMFKVIYDVQRKDGELGKLIDEAVSTPLLQTRSIQQLDVSSDNLAKLAKSIDRFKAKLKYKLNSSSAMRKRASVTAIQPVSKFQKIEEVLNDPHKCFQKAEYPFNDSDSETQKREFLIGERFKQGGENLSFSFKKYLTWLFGRTNQPIEYYLLVANEAEADEAVRKQEEALKYSFRKSPNDRLFKDHAIVFGRTFEKLVDPKLFDTRQLNNAALSAIPPVAASAITVKDIWTEVVQQVCLGTTILKDQIVASVKMEQDKLTFDCKLIQQFGTTQQIQSALPQLVKEIYNDRTIQYGTATALIRQIYNAYPKLTPVNIASVEIYGKVEQLQKKLGLNLDSRDLLPYDGLLLKQKDSSVLFNYIKDSVLPHLNENNIHTLSRILALSFKRNEFQQEIINDYFKITVQQYSQLDSEFDEKMKLQKIAAFAQKMPLNHLKQEVEKIVESMKNPQKQKSIVRTICDILRQRNDSKNADLFEAKWFAPLSPEQSQ